MDSTTHLPNAHLGKRHLSYLCHGVAAAERRSSWRQPLGASRVLGQRRLIKCNAKELSMHLLQVSADIYTHMVCYISLAGNQRIGAPWSQSWPLVEFGSWPWWWITTERRKWLFLGLCGRWFLPRLVGRGLVLVSPVSFHIQITTYLILLHARELNRRNLSHS